MSNCSTSATSTVGGGCGGAAVLWQAARNKSGATEAILVSMPGRGLHPACRRDPGLYRAESRILSDCHTAILRRSRIVLQPLEGVTRNGQMIPALAARSRSADSSAALPCRFGVLGLADLGPFISATDFHLASALKATVLHSD